VHDARGDDQEEDLLRHHGGAVVVLWVIGLVARSNCCCPNQQGRLIQQPRFPGSKNVQKLITDPLTHKNRVSTGKAFSLPQLYPKMRSFIFFREVPHITPTRSRTGVEKPKSALSNDNSVVTIIIINTTCT